MVVLVSDELDVRVDVSGLDDEPVRRRMRGLVFADRDQQRADAIGAAAFTYEGHEFVLGAIHSDGLLLDLHPPIVVVAKRQLVLDEPVTANGFPVVVAHYPSNLRTVRPYREEHATAYRAFRSGWGQIQLRQRARASVARAIRMMAVT